jgi:dTDP-4-amino-4,6-dideoxygalactose transaminase
MDRLKALGIGTQVHYIPVHRQPYYARRSAGLTLPGAEAFYSRTLSLPLFASMNEDAADWVVAGLRKVLGHA